MCDRLRNPPGTHRVAASLVERAPQLDTAHHLDPLYNCAELLNCSINLPSSYNLDLIASAIAVRVRVHLRVCHPASHHTVARLVRIAARSLSFPYRV
jgi:hypothetical protein